MEKFQAIKRRNEKKAQLLPALLQLCVRVVMLGLFLSSPHWLPALCSSARFFFMETLPGVCALLSRPKCLFVISNVIIIFLVGESKLSRSKSPQQPDIYEAYVARCQSLQKAAVAGGDGQVVCEALQVAEATVVEEAPPVEETKEVEDEVVQEAEQEEECGKEEEELDREREEELEGKDEAAAAAAEEEEEEEEELGLLAAEELNRRVEDFIAKMNMQRKLEARMLIPCY